MMIKNKLMIRDKVMIEGNHFPFRIVQVGIHTAIAKQSPSVSYSIAYDSEADQLYARNNGGVVLKVGIIKE